MAKRTYLSITNWTNENFIPKWDGEKYDPLKPGETIKVEEGQATVWAKQMASDHLISEDKADQIAPIQEHFKELVRRAFLPLEKPKPEKKPKQKKKVDDEDFEGLE